MRNEGFGAQRQLVLLTEAAGITTARTALNVVATFDPTGVAAVINAFAKLVCATEQPFRRSPCCLRTRADASPHTAMTARSSREEPGRPFESAGN